MTSTPGLRPVAQFPPFLRNGLPVPRDPRVMETKALIFEEEAGTLPGETIPNTDGPWQNDVRFGTRKKRNVYAGYCPKKTFLDKILLKIKCYPHILEAKLPKKSHGKYFLQIPHHYQFFSNLWRKMSSLNLYMKNF